MYDASINDMLRDDAILHCHARRVENGEPAVPVVANAASPVQRPPMPSSPILTTSPTSTRPLLTASSNSPCSAVWSLLSSSFFPVESLPTHVTCRGRCAAPSGPGDRAPPAPSSGALELLDVTMRPHEPRRSSASPTDRTSHPFADMSSTNFRTLDPVLPHHDDDDDDEVDDDTGGDDNDDGDATGDGATGYDDDDDGDGSRRRQQRQS